MKNKKLTPKIRFKGFSDPWEQRKLEELFSERNERSEKGELLSVTINSGVVKSRSLERKDNSSSNKSNYKIVTRGDIAYNSMRMWQGASGASSYNGIVSPAYTVIVPNNLVDVRFVALSFKRHRMLQIFQKNSQGLTSDTWNLKFPLLKNIKIHVPSKSEQVKIREQINKLLDLIAANEDKINRLKELKKLLMQNIFSQRWRFKGFTDPWEQRKVGKISSIITGGTPKTKVASYWNPDKIPWVSSGEVNKRYIYETEKKISELGFDNSSARWVKENSILIALAGQGKTRGTVAINKIPVTTNQSIAAIQLNESYDANFIFQNLQERYYELRRLSSGDGSRGGLNKKIISDIKVPITNYSEQNKIGNMLCKADNLIAANEDKLGQLKNMKKYLMQNMFI